MPVTSEKLLADRLPGFFEALAKCDFIHQPVKASAKFADDPARLADFLAGLEAPLAAASSAGLFDNPWTAARLGRNEVRNAGVLAWFLNPTGSHGLGDRLLAAILTHARNGAVGGFPERLSTYCTVTVEDSPDGDRASRVDIQIDDPGHLLLVIEVKIDAGEQLGQLERYCNAAATRAGPTRPWRVVFLTIDGRRPQTAGFRDDAVVAMSWGFVSARLNELTRPDRVPSLVSSYLASSFAAHISTF